MVTDIYNPSIKKAKEDNSVSKQHIYSFRLFFFQWTNTCFKMFSGTGEMLSSWALLFQREDLD